MSDGERSEDIVGVDDDAATVITSMLADNGYDPGTAGLRLAVENGGCAGLSYRFTLTDAPDSQDVVCNTERVTVFVDPASTEYIEGATLTVETTAHGTGFVIDNPNAEQECGCGLSFTDAP